MQPFEWSLPTRLVFGAGAFATVGSRVKGLGKKCYILTSLSFGEGARRHLLQGLLEQLHHQEIETLVFDRIEPNPRTSTIDEVAQRVRQYRPRYVIGFGGGSVMDAAKCVALLAVNPGSIEDYLYKGPGKKRMKFNHALPIVCIPTVAATGSEANIHAVVTNWDKHRKTSVFGQALLPALSIIDPLLTHTLNASQTIDSAFDIITHVLESYWTTPIDTPLQDGFSEAIVKTVCESLKNILEGSNLDHARMQMSWSSTLALSGVLSGRDGCWPIHAIEHGISAYSDVSHGRGLAILLPRMIQWNAQWIGNKVKKFNERLFNSSNTKDGLWAFMKKVGANFYLEDYCPAGISLEKFFENIIEHTLEVSGVYHKVLPEPFLANVSPLSAQDIRFLLGECTRQGQLI